MGRRGKPAAPPGLSALLCQAAERRRRPTVRRASAADSSWYRIRNADGSSGDTAEIWLYDEIGWYGTSAQDMVDELKQITARQINLYINSPGGDVFDGLAIYQSLLSHPATVNVRIDGLAASAASFIAQAGDTVTIGANAMVMVHDAWWICIGNEADMHATGDLLGKFSTNVAAIYAARSGGSVDEWRQTMRGEAWYTGAEAVDAGLADEVLAAGKRRKECSGEDCPGCPDCAGAPEDRWDLTVFRYAGRSQAPAPAARKCSGGVVDGAPLPVLPSETGCELAACHTTASTAAIRAPLVGETGPELITASLASRPPDTYPPGVVVPASLLQPAGPDPYAAVMVARRVAELAEAFRDAAGGSEASPVVDEPTGDRPGEATVPADTAPPGPPDPRDEPEADDLAAASEPLELGESPGGSVGDSPTTDDGWAQLVAALTQPEDAFAGLTRGLL